MRINTETLTVRHLVTVGGRLVERESPCSIAAWFRTPMGLYEHWEEAVLACERCDLDPVLCTRAVRVAVTQSGAYRVID
jgi:hypothetical protein